MAELFISHKVMLMKCLQTALNKTFPMAHIRNSLACALLNAHKGLNPTKHQKFTKTNEVNLHMAKPQVCYNFVNLCPLQCFIA